MRALAPRGLARLIAGRIPETALFAVGVLFRTAMLWTYHVENGYDFPDHARYVEWFRDHLQIPFALPNVQYCREAYHPPLYYLLAGIVLRLFGSYHAVQGLGVACGAARLAAIWWGLERHVQSRMARLAALALAAALPVSTQLEGMVYGEPLNNLLGTVAILLALRFFEQRDGRPRLATGAALGVVLGLELLTKVSALTIVMMVAVGVAFDFVLRLRSAGARTAVRRLAPAALAAAALVATSGPHYARNHRQYGKMFLAGWDGPDGWQLATNPLLSLPYLDRRPIGFLVGWEPEIFRFPFWWTGIVPHARLWPVLVASTYVDYYNYSFSPAVVKHESIPVNGHPLRLSGVWPARLSVVGGTWIALVVASAWVASFAHAFARRHTAHLVALAIPLAVFAGQIHFAIRYPFDSEGLIKGAYVQFGAPPLIAVFGLATARLWRRSATRPLAVLNLLAVSLAATYVAYCRFA